MENTPLWSLSPAGIALIIGLLLMVLARQNQWKDPKIKTETDKSKFQSRPFPKYKDLKTLVIFFVSKHPWELLLGMVILGLIVWAIIAKPVRLGGDTSVVPGQPGSPFYFLHWQRDYLRKDYHETATASNVITGVMALAMTIFAATNRSPKKIRVSLLWGLMSLAGSAQWMINSVDTVKSGAILYVIVGIGFLAWSILTRENVNADISAKSPLPLNWEVILVFAFILLASFGRGYALKTIPYGIEGDEAKWTAEVVWLGFTGKPDSSALYHRDALPGSFYMQTIFHKLLGPSLFAARLAVVIFSVVATLIFYFLLRQITAMPIALLAAWLLSACAFDISASRLANVESHVKLWPILTLALLAWAIRVKKWHAYVIVGIAMTIGLLTYDTVWPIGLVVLLIMGVEALQNKENLKSFLQNMMAMLTPVLLSAPLIIPYLASRMSYYELGNKDWSEGMLTVWDFFLNVCRSWYINTNSDFLYNRQGPLINAFLLPWMTFGIAALLATIRHRVSFWTLTWIVLFIFPVPILAHTPLGRVYYPALPAIYILVAVGMYLFIKETLRALGNIFQPLIIAFAVVILIWIPLANFYIYFNEVADDDNRRMRREVAELAGDAAGPDNLVLLVAVPNTDEPLNNEFPMIELFMFKNLPEDQIENGYEHVAIDELLPALTGKFNNRTNLSIILDKFSDRDREKRATLSDALHKCYPRASWVEGKFFDRLDLNNDAIKNPACIGTALSIELIDSTKVKWELQQGDANALLLQCERETIEHEWIEAESLATSPGWVTDNSFVTDWTGTGFLADQFGSQPISINFTLKENETTYIWVRYYKRAIDNSPAQISFNNQFFTFSAVDEDGINQWKWERSGPIEAASGANTAILTRPYIDDPFKFMGLFIDAIVVTTDPQMEPFVNNYEVIPTQRYSFSNPQTQGEISFSFAPGSYRCHAEASSKKPLVDPLGRSPVESNVVEFRIEE